MAEPGPISAVTPTPEETRWASFVMNEQRHKRPVSAEDRTKAGEIMRRARHASGKLGGGKPKASPLVVARAIKDIDAKVAEAQGINASREGETVPAPEPKRDPFTVSSGSGVIQPPAKPVPSRLPIPTQADHDDLKERIIAPERDFREASGRLLDQIQGDMERYRRARDAAAQIVRDNDIRLDIMQRRHDAILDSLRVLDEGRHDA